ncbi:hypothetical protein T458_20340 [Brevibacillus panacihumi W25]|uniref:Uncharacterized protein n=1 Tax=Brevibacillus panacihumi W25 TaxID=1408254 RepID=V6M5L6_9BACL|nr:hypothetical protein T458_20340 [Brevibacillus panacihumi W25]
MFILVDFLIILKSILSVFCTDVAFLQIDNIREYRKHSVIMLKNSITNQSIIHPLTAFIFWKWKRKEYNTQRLQAIHLCQFLNYILIEKRNVLHFV